jgi:hypothetical protein
VIVELICFTYNWGVRGVSGGLTKLMDKRSSGPKAKTQWDIEESRSIENEPSRKTITLRVNWDV